MLNWDINSLNQTHEEMLKQVEQDQLAQEVIDELRKSNPHYNSTLAWVGRRMMTVGQKLVQISGSAEDRQSLYEPDIHLN